MRTGAVSAGAGRAAADAAVVARLRDLAVRLDDEPDAAFRAAARDRLVAMAAARSPAPSAPPRRRWLPRGSGGGSRRRPARLAVGLSGAALAMTVLGTIVGLATHAGPGDLLYGLKRGAEQTRLALAGQDRGQALLELASTRLDELEDLRDGPVELVVDVLGAMDSQTAEGAASLAGQAVTAGDTALARQLAGWASAQSAELAAVQQDLPAGAAGALQTSLRLLDGVTDRAAALQASLACPAGPRTAGADALGPVPADCPPHPPADPVPADGPPGGLSPADGADPAGRPPAIPPVPAPPATGGAHGGSQTSGGGNAPMPAPPRGTANGVPPAPVPPPGAVPGMPSAPLVGGSAPRCVPLLIC